MRYTCNILNKYSEEYLLFLAEKALSNLGFEAYCYDVFQKGLEVKEKLNIKFDKQKILNFLQDKKDIKRLRIKPIEDSSSWFSITLNEGEEETIGNTFLLEWSIVQGKLDFILNSSFFEDIVKNKSLIYCYCYNQSDVSQQSNTHFNKYDDVPKDLKLVTNKYGDKEIDISKNWGKSITVYSLKFIAAPKMWFGVGFNPVLEIDSFKKYKYVTTVTEDYAYIELFDLYDDPTLFRKKQKSFWDFINSKKVIKKYEDDNQSDFTQWLLSQK